MCELLTFTDVRNCSPHQSFVPISLSLETMEALWQNQYNYVVLIIWMINFIGSTLWVPVFRFGPIVEDGSHAQLLAQNGTYARLWNRQVDGFMADGAGEVQEPADLESEVSLELGTALPPDSFRDQ